jgi:hypothetical protein
MNCMDWLARYSEFVSPDAVSTVISAFKDIYANFTDQQTRDDFISNKHNSEAVPTVLQMLRSMRQKRDSGVLTDVAYSQNVSILVSILEPLLINDHNLDNCLKLGGIKDLGDLLFEQQLPSLQAGGKVLKDYFRFTIRCFTSCLRTEAGVVEFMKNDIYLKRILSILEEFNEEELVANCSKVLRLVLRDDLLYDRVMTSFSQLGNFLLNLMKSHEYSPAII